MFIEAKNLKKHYGEGDSLISVLDGVSLSIEQGAICTILGPSGSGKSTLLNVIGGLDSVAAGSIKIDGQEIVGLNAVEMEKYRRDYLGFIFQFYNLIPNLTLRENIQVCEYLSDHKMDIDELIDVLGLKEHEKKFPSQISGGQQQRCAIARALIKNPKLLLCDEPTGALDSVTAREIMILLEEVNRKYGTTMLIVTHNEAISEMSHQVIHIRDGHIGEVLYNETRKSAKELVL